MLGRAYYSQSDDVNAERLLRQALQLRQAASGRVPLPGEDSTLPTASRSRPPTNLHRYLELAPDDPQGRELLAALTPTGDS